MIGTVVIATDGSESVERAVAVALDLAERFDADVHALYQEELRTALTERGETATGRVVERANTGVTTAVREGRPANEIRAYARDMDADVVATGTRGRHGENRFLVGSVAERVVRTCPVPVLTVRQMASDESA